MCLAHEALVQSHGCVNTHSSTSAQLHTKIKRYMRHKINCDGRDLAILYSVRIWTILGEGIKKSFH